MATRSAVLVVALPYSHFAVLAEALALLHPPGFASFADRLGGSQTFLGALRRVAWFVNEPGVAVVG